MNCIMETEIYFYIEVLNISSGENKEKKYMCVEHLISARSHTHMT